VWRRRQIQAQERGGGGGGGGGGPDDSSETPSPSNDATASQSTGHTEVLHTSGQSSALADISKVGQPDTLVSSALDHIEPLVGTVTGELGSGLSTIVSATTDEISKIPLGTVVLSALDHVAPLIGTVTGELGSEPLGIENGTAIGLRGTGEDTPLNLKAVVGFDLHVMPDGGVVATEASLAPPGATLSHSMGDLGFVASMPSADGIGVQSPGISHEVDDLFAVDQNATGLQNNADMTSSNPTRLGTAGAPPVDLGIEGVSRGGAEGTTPDAAPVVHTVGEATDVTPGHSLEFSTSPSSAGDALFQGTKYTDYHMALQNGGSLLGTTSESVSAPTITALPSEAIVLTHADSSAVTQPPEPAAPEHQTLTTSTHSLTVHIH
jgi:hypothetical protein